MPRYSCIPIHGFINVFGILITKLLTVHDDAAQGGGHKNRLLETLFDTYILCYCFFCVFSAFAVLLFLLQESKCPLLSAFFFFHRDHFSVHILTFVFVLARLLAYIISCSCCLPLRFTFFLFCFAHAVCYCSARCSWKYLKQTNKKKDNC